MKLQYYIVVNVVIHISKPKGVAEITNKTNKIKKKGGLSKVTSFTIHLVYSYREVPMFSLNLLKRTLWLFLLNLVTSGLFHITTLFQCHNVALWKNDFKNAKRENNKRLLLKQPLRSHDSTY